MPARRFKPSDLPSVASELVVEFGGHSTAGLKAENQDAFAALAPDGPARGIKGAVAVIADGVSSSRRSAEASQIAVTHFVTDYLSTPDGWTVRASAARVLHAMNAWLVQSGGQGRGAQALVTTFTAVVVKSRTAHVFHAGDSRAWLVRDGRIEQITRDHIRPAGEQKLLTRALGMDGRVQIDYGAVQVRPGDRILLTTDGVHDFLSATELETLCATEPDGSLGLERAAERLTNNALGNGSDDNLSALFLAVRQVPPEDYAEIQQFRQVIPPVLAPGHRIDGYRVLQTLHSSPRSHLYLVRPDDDPDAVPVVLKAPSQSFQDDPQYLQGFALEQWVGLRIDHANVMKAVERRDDSSFLYNLFEYLPFADLRQWMVDNPAPGLEPVRRLAGQIAEGLRAFARMSMVHRDLKPENVLVDESGQVKLVDFGTVQVAGVEEIAGSVEESYPVGSADYMAPEYLLGQTGQSRSDIFSLGVIVYEMLAGSVPFRVPTHKLGHGASYRDWHYQPLARAGRDLPRWLDAVLRKATAPAPNERYQALSEFLHDLRTPSPELLRTLSQQPLMERNPLLFWRALSAVLAALLVLFVLSG